MQLVALGEVTGSTFEECSNVNVRRTISKHVVATISIIVIYFASFSPLYLFFIEQLLKTYSAKV